MQELTNRQKKSILRNNHELAQQYMKLQVIHQNYKALTNEMDCFLFNTSSFLCLSGCELIKKSYHVSLTIYSNYKR